MTSKYLHSELGEIILNQTRNIRRVSIKVRPSGEVRLSFPCGVSKSEVLGFLEQKKQWVKDAKAKLEARKFVIEMPYATRSHSLKLNPAPTTKFSAQITDTELVFTYPNTLNYREEQIQSMIKKALVELWRAEAKEYLPGRLAELAREHGFKFSAVSIRNTHSRWGSCSANDSISLSLHLMRLPDYLIDYILLHELCHTVHRNHGAEFHALLDRVCGGNDKRYNLALRKFLVSSF